MSGGRFSPRKCDVFFESRIEKSAPRFVTSLELARILGLSVHTIRKWRSEGRIKPKVFGRSVRYVVDDVVNALTRKG
jgi:hypothetical protein